MTVGCSSGYDYPSSYGPGLFYNFGESDDDAHPRIGSRLTNEPGYLFGLS